MLRHSQRLRRIITLSVEAFAGTSYHRYVERGYSDGYEVDDWLQSTTDVYQVLLNPNMRVEDVTTDVPKRNNSAPWRSSSVACSVAVV